MRRTTSSTIAKPLPTAQAARLPRPLRRWLLRFLPTLDAVVACASSTTGADAGRRHCFARSQWYFLLYHGLTRSPSLRQSYAAFAAEESFARFSGLASDAPDGGLTVSYSQLAHSNTSRPPAFFAAILAALVRRVAPLQDWPLPLDVHLLDATFIYLSARLAGGWLPERQRQHASGVKVQVDYNPRCDVPTVLLLTDSKTPDCRALDHAVLEDPVVLAGLRGETLTFDLGYYSHARFAALVAAGVHFVTRLQGQALVQFEEEQPVQVPLPLALPVRMAGQSAITVLRDSTVTLGSAQNRAGESVPHLRVVTARVPPAKVAGRQGKEPVTYTIVTDRFDLPAAVVVLVYRWRWEIEQVFLWMKEHLHLEHLLGTSRNAVLVSLSMAFILHLVCLLATQALGLPERLPCLVGQLQRVWLQLRLEYDLPPRAVQLPLPFDGVT